MARYTIRLSAKGYRLKYNKRGQRVVMQNRKPRLALYGFRSSKILERHLERNKIKNRFIQFQLNTDGVSIPNIRQSVEKKFKQYGVQLDKFLMEYMTQLQDDALDYLRKQILKYVYAYNYDIKNPTRHRNGKINKDKSRKRIIKHSSLNRWTSGDIAYSWLTGEKGTDPYLGLSFDDMVAKRKDASIHKRRQSVKLNYAHGYLHRIGPNRDAEEWARISEATGDLFKNAKVDLVKVGDKFVLNVKLDSPYAAYVEFGTGIKGAKTSNPARPSNWHFTGKTWYFKKNKQFYKTKGQSAKPIMYNTSVFIRNLTQKNISKHKYTLKK